jgi:hypothetical protein
MNTRGIQGLALILGAVCSLITAIPSVPSLLVIERDIKVTKRKHSAQARLVALPAGHIND